MPKSWRNVPPWETNLNYFYKLNGTQYFSYLQATVLVVQKRSRESLQVYVICEANMNRRIYRSFYFICKSFMLWCRYLGK